MLLLFSTAQRQTKRQYLNTILYKLIHKYTSRGYFTFQTKYCFHVKKCGVTTTFHLIVGRNVLGLKG